MNQPSSPKSPDPTTKLDPQMLARLSKDPEKRIDEVIAHFRATRNPVELFEAMKMKSRLRNGLPMVPPQVNDGSSDTKEQTEEVQRKLETDLLDACRQAGAMLIEDGKIGEGWMYLRPLGDLPLARRLLSDVQITDDNYDEMVHVLLHEGVDLHRGYTAVIEQQGTCNSITLYDQAIAGRSRADRAAASACLLNHFYEELLTLVRQDFESRAADNGVEAAQIIADLKDLSLSDLIAKHKWILGGGGYHLDTTHLSSTVRFATVLNDPKLIDRAWQLCQYGRRLPADFQYPGDEPFVDFYPAHIAYFGALMGQNVDSALRQFEQKARNVDAVAHGSAAIEAYIDLLDRLDRPAEALQATMDLFPDEVPTQRVMPDLIAMADRAYRAGNEEVVSNLERFCFERGDLLSVAAIAGVRC